MDYDYKFLRAEVGWQRRVSDGDFRNSAFDLALSNNSLTLPDPKTLCASNDPFWVTTGEPKKIPMAFVTDDTFPFTKHWWSLMIEKISKKKKEFLTIVVRVSKELMKMSFEYGLLDYIICNTRFVNTCESRSCCNGKPYIT